MCDGIVLCTMVVVGLYPKRTAWGGSVCIKKTTPKPKKKYVSTGSIIDLAEVVLKNNA